jgi:hypothetical protein
MKFHPRSRSICACIVIDDKCNITLLLLCIKIALVAIIVEETQTRNTIIRVSILCQRKIEGKKCYDYLTKIRDKDDLMLIFVNHQ